MGVRFIAGPAGSGKTSYIVRRIADELSDRKAPGPPILFIVPDQSTFQMERKILTDPRIQGFADLHILGWRRLCRQVMDESGGVNLPFITPVGRSMAIQSVLWDSREQLTVFAPMVSYPGFRETLGRTLGELLLYEVDASQIEARASGSGIPYFDQKAHDLALVQKKYREFLEGRFFDPEDYLEMAVTRIASSSLLRGAQVWIDGFSGFTPKEYKVLGQILVAAQEVNLALCIDEGELRRAPSATSLFHPTRELHDHVVAMAEGSGIRVLPTLHLGSGHLPRFRSSLGLGRLEKAFREGPELPLEASDAQGVVLVSAANPTAEIEFVARRILALVREGGMRYRDITVEARDLSGYVEIVRAVFGDHKIPFFLDQKRSLSHHPVSELLRAALDVVTSCVSQEAVFRYLKTDLVPVSREDVDRLENYVLAHGIRGERFFTPEPWEYRKRTLLDDEEPHRDEDHASKADEVRREALAHLGRFYKEVGPGAKAASPRVLSRAVYALLMDLGVPETLEKWQDDLEASGDLLGARDHAGVWGAVMEILEQMDEILGERPCDAKTYSMLLSAGLQDIRLGAIPPSLDQVLVGAIDRTRQPDCLVTFLVGALEGTLPLRRTEDSVFGDKERAYLGERGILVGPDSKQDQLHEQYLVYVALTRPQHTLYITYPLGDSGGGALTPSHIVGLVKRALPQVPELHVGMGPEGDLRDHLEYVTPARARGIAVQMLSTLGNGGSAHPLWLEVFRWFLEGGRREKSVPVFGSLGFTNKLGRLPAPFIDGIYGTRLQTSVSRLERFGACPFQHFAADGLGLKEKDTFKLEPADAGTFLHEAMKELYERVLDWEHLDPDQIANLAGVVVDEMVPAIGNEIFMSTARYRYVAQSLGHIVKRAARTTCEHMGRGKFRPVGAEVTFGMGPGLPAYRIPTGTGAELLLRGQIDRVDAVALDGNAYLRIVDYKKSRRTLDLVDVWHGLSLQILVYLAVAQRNWRAIVPSDFQELAGALPAGAFYFTLKDPLLSSLGPLPPEEALGRVLAELKMTGFVLLDPQIVGMMDGTSQGPSDIIPVRFTKDGPRSSHGSSAVDFQALLGFVENKVGELGRRIYDGDIEIAPYRRGQRRACTFCPFGPLCTFDILTPGNRYRILESPPGGVWEAIRGGEGR